MRLFAASYQFMPEAWRVLLWRSLAISRICSGSQKPSVQRLRFHLQLGEPARGGTVSLQPTAVAVTDVPGMAALGLRPERPALILGRDVWGAAGRLVVSFAAQRVYLQQQQHQQRAQHPDSY